MRVTVHLHGQCGTGSMTLDATSAADAIEGFSRQTGVFDGMLVDKRPPLRAVGFPTKESLYAPLSEDVTEIHLIPAMVGGGGNFLKIVLGAVLIVGGLLLTPTNPVLGAALVGAGVGMVIGGVMGFFMKSPKASKTDDPEASKYFGSRVNTVASGTPIARRYGRVAAFGQVLTVNVDSQDLVLGSFPESP